MLAAERRSRIAEQLQAEARVVVSQLSAQFEVSEETIRRDLERLEKEGLARRTYGGAILIGEDRTAPPYAVRKNTNPEGKMAIARRLAALIRDGDTLMVDESSTAAYAVRALRGLRDVTVITNSLELLGEAGSQESWHVISTGGTLKSDVMALTGPHALRTIESYHVRWAVLSCRGLDGRLGMADSSDDIVQIKRAMMAAADQTVLLADWRKFGRTGFVSLGPLELAGRLITDREPPETWKTALREHRVALEWCGSETIEQHNKEEQAWQTQS